MTDATLDYMNRWFPNRVPKQTGVHGTSPGVPWNENYTVICCHGSNALQRSAGPAPETPKSLTECVTVSEITIRTITGVVQSADAVNGPSRVRKESDGSQVTQIYSNAHESLFFLK